MRELINNVIQWANDRNIIEGSTAIKQLDKTSEEFNELQRAVGSLNWAKVLDRETKTKVCETRVRTEIVDGFGDVLVTLIIAAKQLDIELEDALAAAYEEIRHRKGKLIDGLFHKEV